MNETEQIVFVTEDGQPTGEVGPKLESHNANTKVHLAFSCYIFRKSDNKLLVTQRALSKKVWPGVWTNSVCGHPMPGETIEDALRRRVHFEAGITQLDNLSVVLPKYRYTTPPYKGIIENEFCPVFVAYTDQEPDPNPEEIEDYEWMTWPQYVKILDDESYDVSYWAKDVYQQLKDLEPFKGLSLV